MRITTKAFGILLMGVFFSCSTPKKNEQQIRLTNTSDIDLIDKPVSIVRSKISKTYKVGSYPLLISGTDTISSQLSDLDGDGAWDELFFVTDFSANEKKMLTLKWVEQAPDYVVRTSARFGKRSSLDSPVQPKTEETMAADELPLSLGYQQYQTDGPSWENDKIGFRHYLDGRNAKDLFGKKVPEMSPENVGINADGAVEDNYHVMEDWGRDILSVGNSVGLGGYALATETELLRLGVTVDDSINNIASTTFKILEEGPVKSVLSYSYTDWKPNETSSYSVEEKTTIWPGMYGYMNTVAISGLQGDEDLVVGLVNIHNDSPLTLIDENEKYVVLYTHDKQTYDKEWWLGMALILPKDRYLGHGEAPKTGNLSNSFLAKLKIKEGEPLSYYAIAGWELSDKGFRDETYFADYIKQLTNQLSAEVDIQIKD